VDPVPYPRPQLERSQRYERQEHRQNCFEHRGHFLDQNLFFGFGSPSPGSLPSSDSESSD
jgi:hypothetical protein